MPYKIKKSGSGYKVCKKVGEKCFSKKALPKSKATAQLKAIMANESVIPGQLFDTFASKYLREKSSDYRIDVVSGKKVCRDPLPVSVLAAGDPVDEPADAAGTPKERPKDYVKHKNDKYKVELTKKHPMTNQA